MRGGTLQTGRGIRPPASTSGTAMFVAYPCSHRKQQLKHGSVYSQPWPTDYFEQPALRQVASHRS